METPGEELIPQDVPLEEPQFVGNGPVGTIDEEIRALQDGAPEDTEYVTNDEQAKYNDFVSRALLYMSDNKPRGKGVPSGRQAVMQQLNNVRQGTAEAIGRTTATIAFMIHNNGKRQGVEYSPDVLFHGATEVTAAVYFMGAVAGIFKDMPQIDPNTLFKDYEFSDEEGEVLEVAKMHAVDHFGRLMQQAGQITPEQKQEAIAYWKEQIDKEAEAGASIPDELAANLDLSKVQPRAPQGPQAGAVPQQVPAQEFVPPEEGV